MRTARRTPLSLAMVFVFAAVGLACSASAEPPGLPQKNKAKLARLAEDLGKNPDRGTRENAAKKLGKMGRAAFEAAPALIAALTDGDERVRARAATALGKINPPGDEVVAALEKALDNDESDGVRRAARGALVKMGLYPAEEESPRRAEHNRDEMVLPGCPYPAYPAEQTRGGGSSGGAVGAILGVIDAALGKKDAGGYAKPYEWRGDDTRLPPIKTPELPAVVVPGSHDSWRTPGSSYNHSPLQTGTGSFGHPPPAPPPSPLKRDGLKK